MRAWRGVNEESEVNSYLRSFYSLRGTDRISNVGCVKCDKQTVCVQHTVVQVYSLYPPEIYRNINKVVKIGEFGI